MRIYYYMRVSTEEQSEARQKEALKSWCAANDVPIGSVKGLLDEQSGNTLKRPKLDALMNFACPGDLVIIKSLDRLSRNYNELKEVWNRLTSPVEQRGLGLDILVLDMPILDTRGTANGPLGVAINDIIFTLLSYMAEEETRFRAQRQREGLDAMERDEKGRRISRKTGKPTGRHEIELPLGFESQYDAWKNGSQTAVQTMKNLNLKRTTFYKLVKEYENRG